MENYEQIRKQNEAKRKAAAVRLAQAGYPKGADYSRFADESKLFKRLASYFADCRGMTIEGGY